LNRSLLFVAAALLLWGFGEGMFFNFVPIYRTGSSLSEYEIPGARRAGFSMQPSHIPQASSDRIDEDLCAIAWLLGLVSTMVMGVALALPLS
jgi:hypothetical protein